MPLTEDEARRVLRLMNVDASNPSLFAAERRERGWCFGWRPENGAPRMGTRSWVVADNGRGRRLGLAELADDAIAAELDQGTCTDV